MAKAAESVRSVVERHQNAFAQLQKQVDLVDRLDDEHPGSAAEHLELLRLESEVEEAALAMTTVWIYSQLTAWSSSSGYIDHFSRTQKSGLSVVAGSRVDRWNRAAVGLWDIRARERDSRIGLTARWVNPWPSWSTCRPLTAIERIGTLRASRELIQRSRQA